MPNIKVGVEADVSRAQREINKLKPGAGGGQSAPGAPDAELKRQQALERAQARQRQEIERTIKAYKELGRAVSEFQAKAANSAFRSSQGGRSNFSAYTSGLSLHDVLGNAGSFSSRFSSPAEAEVVRQKIMQSVGNRAGFGAVPPHGRGFGGRMSRYGTLAGTAVGAIASGSLTSGGLFSAAGSLAGGGIGGLFGGPVGAAFGSALFGGVGGKLDATMQDSVQAATSASLLRAALGQVSNSFEDVRRHATEAGRGLGITSLDVQRYGMTFARTAGSRDMLDVGRSVQDATGFARGFGLGDEFSTRFFAQLRQAKVTMNPEDSRRMGGVIAEGIVKGGGTAKAEEFMGAVSGFMAHQLNSAGGPANVEAFSSLLSTLSGRGGLDTGVAGGLLNKADAAIRGSGDLATESFKLAAAQRLYGNNFSGLDMLALEQGGFFGSARSTLGPGSALHGLAASMGDKGYMRRLGALNNSGSSFGLGVVNMAVANNPGNAQFAAQTISRALGLNIEEAAHLANAARDPTKLGTLRGIGGSMSMRNMASAAQVLTADESALRKMAADFAAGNGIKSPMHKDNAAELLDLSKNGSRGQLQNYLLNTLKNVEVTDLGQNVAATSADIKEVTMSITDKLIPAVEGVKEAVLAGAGLTPESFTARQRNWATAGEKGALDKALAERGELANAAHGGLGRMLGWAVNSGGIRDQLNAKDAEVERLRAAYQAAGSKFDAAHGLKPGEAAAGSARRFDGNAQAGLTGGGDASLPRNERNNNPGNIEYGPFARRHGATGSDGRFAIFPNKEAGSAAMNSLLGGYYNSGLDTVSKIIGKWAPGKENDTAAYAARVAKALGVSPDAHLTMDQVRQMAPHMAGVEGSTRAYVDMPTPVSGSGAQQRSGGGQTINVNGSFMLVDPLGRQVAAPSYFESTIGAPSMRRDNR